MSHVIFVGVVRCHMDPQKGLMGWCKLIFIYVGVNFRIYDYTSRPNKEDLSYFAFLLN